MTKRIGTPALVALVWMSIGVLSYGQSYANALMLDEMDTFRVVQALPYALARWLYWLPVTLILLRLQTSTAHAKRSLSSRIATHLAFAIVLLTAQAFYQAALVQAVYGEGQGYWFFVRIFLTRTVEVQAFTYIAIFGTVHGLDAVKRLRERERDAAQLETNLVQAQLKALEMQLHPHFLFNTLQTISLLVRRDPALAEKTVTRLGDLLRITLDRENVADVTLREELEFLSLYLDIERTRFPDRLAVEFDVAPELMDTPVPNLILQPLIENAVRYAVAPRMEGGVVRLSARATDGHLVLSVVDDGPGMKPSDGEGIGISVTRERLEKRYGAGSFVLHSPPGGGVEATIRLPLQTESSG